MNPTIRETDCKQAWRLIRAMQTNMVFNNWSVVVRLSCYLEKALIAEKIQRNGYLPAQIRKFKRPFPLNLLPVPAPHYFHLFDIRLAHIADLALSCNDYLMFELAFIDKAAADNLKNRLAVSENTLYVDFLTLGAECSEFFVCGFDFDDPVFSSGVSQALNHNFIPNYLKHYF